MKHTLVLLLAASACTPWTAFPDVEGPGDLNTVTAGEYAGIATLEVRAFAGPLMVKRELCTTDANVSVDLAAPSLLEGEFTCQFESMGEVDADFTGDETTLPDISGELDAERLIADWEGYFIDASSFYADMIGSDNIEGLRIEYRGFVEANRVGPLGSSTLGG